MLGHGRKRVRNRPPKVGISSDGHQVAAPVLLAVDENGCRDHVAVIRRRECLVPATKWASEERQVDNKGVSYKRHLGMVCLSRSRPKAGLEEG